MVRSNPNINLAVKATGINASSPSKTITNAAGVKQSSSSTHSLSKQGQPTKSSTQSLARSKPQTHQAISKPADSQQVISKSSESSPRPSVTSEEEASAFDALAADAQKYGSIDVMISLHCTSMGPSAAWLKEELEKRGVSVWVCTDALQGGENFRDGIGNAVRSSRVFLPLINLQWTESGECENEYMFALRANLISHDSGKTQRRIVLPDKTTLSGIRRPAMLPIKFPNLPWNHNPRVEQLGASTNFIICDRDDLMDPATQAIILVKVLNGLRAFGIRVQSLQSDPPFLPLNLRSATKTMMNLDPVALTQQVIAGIQHQLQNAQDLFAMLTVSPAQPGFGPLVRKDSVQEVSLLKSFRKEDLKSKYIGYCTNDRDGVEVVWSMEFNITVEDDKVTAPNVLAVKGTMVARPEHVVNHSESEQSKASFEKFTDHITKSHSAEAMVEGRFFLLRGVVRLDAVSKKDEHGLIRLCKYRLILERGVGEGKSHHAKDGDHALGLFQKIDERDEDEFTAVIRLVAS